jgi:hypothetical protein
MNPTNETNQSVGVKVGLSKILILGVILDVVNAVADCRDPTRSLKGGRP